MTQAWGVLALTLCAAAASAQAPRTACPVVNGIAWSAGPADSARAPGDTMSRQDSRTAIDTTWTFDIREKTWSWPEFAASVGLGFNGTRAPAGTGGTTPAPGSATGQAWSVCAAASVGMRNSTLTLRNARGTVHLRADVRALTDAARAVRDSAGRPRR